MIKRSREFFIFGPTWFDNKWGGNAIQIGRIVLGRWSGQETSGSPSNPGVLGRGSGQVSSVLAFYSDNPSSNPGEANYFSVKLLLKTTKVTKKRLGLAHLKLVLLNFNLTLKQMNVGYLKPKLNAWAGEYCIRGKISFITLVPDTNKSECYRRQIFRSPQKQLVRRRDLKPHSANSEASFPPPLPLNLSRFFRPVCKMKINTLGKLET